MTIETIFGYPVMLLTLDFDLEKLTDFAHDEQSNDSEGLQHTNLGGWHSKVLVDDEIDSAEFNRLKRTIGEHLDVYHSEFFKDTTFTHDVKSLVSNMWLNINDKGHGNALHHHPDGMFSGTFYIKHDNTPKNGDLVFQNPLDSKLDYILRSHHLHRGNVKEYGHVISKEIRVLPEENMLIYFPAWLFHWVDINLSDNRRISLSFDTVIL